MRDRLIGAASPPRWSMAAARRPGAGRRRDGHSTVGPTAATARRRDRRGRAGRRGCRRRARFPALGVPLGCHPRAGGDASAAGVCWLDYDGDGWLDLYAVNSYSARRGRPLGGRGRPARATRCSTTTKAPSSTSATGRAPTSAIRGNGCVAADFDLDGRTDLYVTGAEAASCCGTTATARSPRARRQPGSRRSAGTRGPRSATSTATVGPTCSSPATPTWAARSTGDAGVPQHLHRRPRPALPEPGPRRRGRRDLPGGGRRGGARGGRLRVRARRAVLRPRPRRRPRPVRRQRHQARPPVRQRGLAGRCGRRSGRARVPVRRAGRQGRGRRPRSGHGRRRGRLRWRRPPGPVRHQRPGAGPRRVPRRRSRTWSIRPSWTCVPTSASTSGGSTDGGCRGQTSTSTPTSTSSWSTATSRSPISTPMQSRRAFGNLDGAGGAGRSRGRRRDRRARRGRSADRSRAARPPTSTTTATSTSPSTRSADRWCCWRTRAAAGHWLEVALDGFAPGAMVTVVLADGRGLVREVQAGGSYLSSEDPRPTSVWAAGRWSSVVVRWPGGEETTPMTDVAAGSAARGGARPSLSRGADECVAIGALRSGSLLVLAAAAGRDRESESSSSSLTRIDGCEPGRSADGHSVARVWDEALLDAIRRDVPAPTVHARNLFHVSAAMWDAWAAYDPDRRGLLRRREARRPTTSRRPARRRSATPPTGCCCTGTRRRPGCRRRSTSWPRRWSRCATGSTTSSTDGDSPAALGNRIAAAVIETGRADGSLEQQRYVDTDYRPVNPRWWWPSPGATMPDPNRWQPLALRAARGAERPARSPATCSGSSARTGAASRAFALPASRRRRADRSRAAAAARRRQRRCVQAGRQSSASDASS